MAMSRKDYVKFAALLADSMGSAGTVESDTINATVRNIARDMAEVFAADNPNFDRERFLTAAGVK